MDLHCTDPSQAERGESSSSERKLAWVVDIVQIPVLEVSLSEDPVFFADNDNDDGEPVSQDEKEGIEGLFEAVSSNAGENEVDGGGDDDEERSWNSLDPWTEYLDSQGETVQVRNVVGDDGKLHGREDTRVS